MFEYMAEKQVGSPIDLSQVPGFGAMLRQNLAGVRTQFPALASAPRILQESLIFPYVEGAVFLQGLWATHGRVAPFGEMLPLSTEQILTSGAAAPLELALEVSGGRIVHEDVLGRLELGVLVDEHLGALGLGLADGWEGDRYALVEHVDGTRVLVAIGLWESEAARDRFASAMESVADRFGGPLHIDRREVAGRPASVLTVGSARGIEVRAVEADRR
jgi:hypothetical protein